MNKDLITYLAGKCDINEKNFNNETPLDLSYKQNNNMSDLLVKLGAKKSVKMKQLDYKDNDFIMPEVEFDYKQDY